MPKVEYQNYIPNSLRKNRATALQQDLQNIYNQYINQAKILTCEEITVGMFGEIWKDYKMNFLFQCLVEDQSEDQFAQLAYQVVLKGYFYQRNKIDKIFAIFCLYHLFYACQNHKKICMSPKYLHQLKKFILANKSDKNSHYMKVVLQLHQKCFIYCTKIGLRNPIVKANGSPARKPVILKIDPLEHITNIEIQFKQDNKQSLKEQLTNYEKLKKQMFGDCGANRDKFKLDVYFCNRVERLTKNYKEYINMLEVKKKQEENQ